MPKARLFVAVPLPPEMEKILEEVLKKVFKKSSGIKWVSKQQLHITLQFLGELDEARIPKLSELLKEASELFKPFEMELGGVGAFPNLNHPRVLFVPIILGRESFRQLAIGIADKTKEVGVQAEDREFHAHVTLGRVKDSRGVGVVVKELEGICPAKFGKSKVERFTLFKSQLTPHGSIHSLLEEFWLRG